MDSMPEISILRYGGLSVRTRSGSGYSSSDAIVVFEGTRSSEGPIRGKMRNYGGQDVPLMTRELRLLSDQLRILADCIDAEEEQRAAEARKAEALRRLKDAESNG